MRKLFIFLLVISATLSHAQPYLNWAHVYGNSGDDMPVGFGINSDGSFMIGGTTNSGISGFKGVLDFWLIKTDTSHIIWQKTYGGKGSEWPVAVFQTTDSGYFMVGQTYSNDGDVHGNHGSLDIWALRLDDTGKIEWQRTIGSSNLDLANDAQQTKDGGYIIAGETGAALDGDVTDTLGGREDAWIIKLNARGQIEWQKTYGGSLQEMAECIQQTKDGGYIFGGWTFSTDKQISGPNKGESDCWVVKTDDTGKIIWSKTYGSPGLDEVNKIIQTKDGGYLVLASTDSLGADVTKNNGMSDAWILKLDSTGSLEWQRSYGGSRGDDLRNVIVTGDSGYLLSGGTNSNDGDIPSNHSSDADSWLVKMDNNFNVQWSKTMGGLLDEGVTQVCQLPDGSIMALNGSHSDDGDVKKNYGGTDVWMTLLGAFPASVSNISKGTVDITIYPTVTKNIVNIDIANLSGTTLITVSDADGRKLKEIKTDGSIGTTSIDLSSLPPSVYLITVRTGSFFKTERVVRY